MINNDTIVHKFRNQKKRDMKLFSFFLLFILLNTLINAQNDPVYDSDELKFHRQSGIYLNNDELLCVVRECKEIFNSKLLIQNGKYSNTYSDAYNEEESVENLEIKYITELDDKSTLFKYTDEYNDKYFLFYYPEDDKKTWTSFWKGYKGEYFLYESWSNYCPNKEEFLEIVSSFLSSQKVEYSKSKLVTLEEALSEEFQSFIKQSTGQ